jgi:hypothetical protein
MVGQIMSKFIDQLAVDLGRKPTKSEVLAYIYEDDEIMETTKKSPPPPNHRLEARKAVFHYIQEVLYECPDTTLDDIYVIDLVQDVVFWKAYVRDTFNNAYIYTVEKRFKDEWGVCKTDEYIVTAYKQANQVTIVQGEI